MNIIEIIIISIILAMDCFTVSICKGITINKKDIKKYIIIAIYFGVFQLLMTVLGYFISSGFKELITEVSKIIGSLILFIIGVNMIIHFKDNETFDDKIDIKTMIPLAIATSIDALAVGISFAMLNVNIISSSIIIGITSFILSFIGVFIGSIFKSKLSKNYGLIGGLVLILLAIKMLL